MENGAQRPLTPDLFGPQEVLFATAGELTASAFAYPSGVAAIRIRNSLGELVVLPFRGQQIWDARFLGRRLTMGSMFDEPVATDDYLANYGAFFIHCGVTAMGNPGPEDRHPLHGELPNARYQSAALECGTDGEGRTFMAVTGTYTHRVAFSAGYVATPRVALSAGSSVIDAELSVRNLRASPLELMYLAHVNFRPVDGGRIVDGVPDDADYIAVRTDFPPNFKVSSDHRAFVAAVKRSPALHREIVAGRRIDPELVLVLSTGDRTDGLVRALQLHPDGTSDFIAYSARELPVAVRWMTRTGDEDALGLLLPATAWPNGFAAARAAGELVAVSPGGTWRCALRFGALDPDATRATMPAIAGQRDETLS